ncbi:MAG: CDP-archaeol synthase [Mycoplasmatota bacterium]
MKTRIISAIVAIAITLPALILGGIYFHLLLFIIAILSLKELLDIKKTKKPLPYFVEFISYMILTLMIFGMSDFDIQNFSIDTRLLAALFLSLLTPTILYKDKEKYSINDAFYLSSVILFVGITNNLALILRNESLNYLLYLLLITMTTDTYALITGMLVGKKKLIAEISPKKTYEGLVGGTFMGVFVSVVFYMTVIDPNINVILITIISLFLSILGQFGDLVFSVIKRYFGKKDFSNIMPGHGGVLDRLDSFLFVILGFMFFITLL